MDTSRGAALANLLLDGFNGMVEEVIAALERRGHPGVTATHAFALQAIDRGAQNAAELGRALRVSRQAAAKTITTLEELGYIERHTDPSDGRRKQLDVTARGYDMVRIGGAVFDELRARWSAQLGREELEAIESGLSDVVRAGRKSPASMA